MNKIKSFVTKLLRGILNDEDKRELIEILTLSLQEKVDDLVEAGTPVEEAIARSLSEFGTSTDVLKAFPETEKQKRMSSRHHLNNFIFALCSYVIICSLAVFINYSFLGFFQTFWWAGIVGIATLFWPLAMFYVYLKAKR